MPRAAPKQPLDTSTRVALLVGKEAFVREAHVQSLTRTLQKTHPGLQVVRLRAGETTIADTLDEARSFALLATHKLILVADANDLIAGESNRRAMERYCQSPTDAATLVLLADTWRKGKLDAMIAKVGAIVPCEALSHADTRRWVISRAKQAHGVPIEPDAAALLIERLGTSLMRLDTELAKLSAHASPIDRSAIESLVPMTREEVIWDIQGDVLAARPEHAARKIREALEVSRHPPVLACWALMDLARKLHAFSRGIDQGIPAPQLARTLKVWGAVGRPLESLARRIDPARAADLLRDAIDTDIALKSGLGDPARRLERLAISISLAAR